MIKPYYKENHTATIVETKEYGIINLNELPIQVEKHKKGKYEICWIEEICWTNKEKRMTLCEIGGSSHLDFGGRELTVIKEIE